MATSERVHFRMLLTPCCGALLCWVNPRLPNYCPECGKSAYPEIKGAVMFEDNEAWLKYKGSVGYPSHLKPAIPVDSSGVRDSHT